MLRPTWLDKVIGSALGDDDAATARAIVKAIAEDPKFIAAIERGLATKIKEGTLGRSRAQVIRQAILKLVESP